MIANLYFSEGNELLGSSSMSDRYDFHTSIEDPPIQCRWCGTMESKEWKHSNLRFGDTECYCSEKCTLAGTAALHLMWARICLAIGIINILLDVVMFLRGFYVGFGGILIVSLFLTMFVALRNTSKKGIAFREEIP